MDTEKPTPRFMAGLTAVLIALGTVAIFMQPGYGGPSSAPCLIPGLVGVLDGILVAHDRRRWAASGEGPLPHKRPRLRARAVSMLFLAVCLVAVLEQQLAQIAYPRAPFWMRVAATVFFAVFAVSELGSFILATDPPPDLGPQARDR